MHFLVSHLTPLYNYHHHHHHHHHHHRRLINLRASSTQVGSTYVDPHLLRNRTKGKTAWGAHHLQNCPQRSSSKYPQKPFPIPWATIPWWRCSFTFEFLAL